MRLSGVALEGEAKEKFNANRMQLAEISSKFGNHVRVLSLPICRTCPCFVSPPFIFLI